MNWYEKTLFRLKGSDGLEGILIGILGIAFLLCVVVLLMSILSITVILATTNELSVGLLYTVLISLLGIVAFGGIYAISTDNL